MRALNTPHISPSLDSLRDLLSSCLYKSSTLLHSSREHLVATVNQASLFIEDKMVSPSALFRPYALVQALLASSSIAAITPRVPQTDSIFQATTGFTETSITSSTGGGATCLNGKISVTASAENTKINYSVSSDQRNVTGTIQLLLESVPTIYTTTNGGPNTVSGTWKLNSRLCFPSSAAAAAKVTTVQLLTHGSTLDSTYWDFAKGYSYIDAAVAAGYATFSYDRLGVSGSPHPDPIQVVQAAIQVEILHQLVLQLRSAPGLGGKAFKKVVGVGHSAGSTFTSAVTAKYPADFDAVALTGITVSTESVAAAQAANCLINANSQGGRFAGLANGYFTVGSGILGLQFSFFRYPFFDNAILQKQVATIATNTLGELLTFATIFSPAPAYTNPVLIFNGANDYVFCGGNCLLPADKSAATLATLYPAAGAKGKAVNGPNAGHNLFQHLGAQGFYKTVIDFIKSNGL